MGFLFVVAVIVQPLALIVFPVCVGFVVIFLQMNRAVESTPFLLPAHQIPLRRLLYLLLIPLIMTVMYAIAESSGFPVLAEADAEGSPLSVTPFIFLISMFAGFFMLFYSVWRVWRQRVR